MGQYHSPGPRPLARPGCPGPWPPATSPTTCGTSSSPSPGGGPRLINSSPTGCGKGWKPATTKLSSIPSRLRMPCRIPATCSLHVASRSRRSACTPESVRHRPHTTDAYAFWPPTLPEEPPMAPTPLHPDCRRTPLAHGHPPGRTVFRWASTCTTTLSPGSSRSILAANGPSRPSYSSCGWPGAPVTVLHRYPPPYRTGSRPPPRTAPPSLRPDAGISISGWLMSSARVSRRSGSASPLPDLVDKNEAWATSSKGVHMGLNFTLALLVIAHVGLR